jgi:hypothetical protein
MLGVAGLGIGLESGIFRAAGKLHWFEDVVKLGPDFDSVNGIWAFF